jgi:phosphotransferase family enzyme
MTLGTVVDPVELARQLRDLLSWDTSQEIRLRVLRWKRASRCTFEIALPTARGWQELIGKVYAEDRSDVYRTMEEMRHAGFGPEAEFGIPRAVAFLTPLRLLLYEKAPGNRARKTIVQASGPESAHAAERCAQWLACFHARAPRSGRVFHLDDQLRSLDRAWRGLAELGSPLAEKAGRLFEQVNAAARELGDGDLCAGHGTYTPGQVLVAEGRTVTVDWDTYHVADPSHDVARFLVELKRMGLKYFRSTHAFDGAAGVFLKTYAATSRSDVTRRLPFQEAAICLDRAKNDVDKQGPGWCEKAEAMLDEGLRV